MAASASEGPDGWNADDCAVLRAKIAADPEQLVAALTSSLSLRGHPQERTTALCWWLLSGLQCDPQSFISKLQCQYGTGQHRCGKIWNTGYVAYRCRTCALSVCMSLCADCFQAADHVGHDFCLFKSCAGGACDCGDINVCRSQGFCPAHSQVESGGPEVPPDEVRYARLVVDTLFHWVLRNTIPPELRQQRSRWEASDDEEASGSDGRAPDADEDRDQFAHEDNEEVEEGGEDDQRREFDPEEIAAALAVAARLHPVVANNVNDDLNGDRVNNDDGGAADEDEEMNEDVNDIVVNAGGIGAEALLALVIGEVAELRRRGAVRRRSSLAWRQEQADTRSKPVFEFLQALCESGDVLRRVVCDVALERIVDTDDAPLVSSHFHFLIDALMLWACRSGFPAPFCGLILVMLPDVPFKEEFVRVFSRHYKALTISMAESPLAEEISTRLIHISVQLYSSSSLAFPAVVNDHLLDNMFSALEWLCERASNTDGVIDCESRIARDHLLGAATSDIVNVLTHKEVSRYMLQNNELIRRWVRLLGYLQYMDTVNKQLGVHVEYERESWGLAFGLEMEMSGRALTPFLTCCNPVDGESFESNGVTSTVREIARYLQSLWGKRGFVFFEAATEGDRLGLLKGALVLKHSETHAVDQTSFHIPLHRWLAAFVSNLVAHTDMTPLQVLCATEQDHNSIGQLAQRLLEHPLLIQVLKAEVRSNMWSRNGDSVYRQSWFYQSSNFSDYGADMDLYMLQLCATLIPPTYTIGILVRHFGLDPWLSDMLYGTDDSSADIKEHGVTLTEDMIVLLLNIISRRQMMGMETRDIIRMEIAARLAKPMTHSQLVENLSARCDQPEVFEEILKELADYREPSGFGNGTYTLKRTHWATTFDPLLLLHRTFLRREFQTAMESYKAQNLGSVGQRPPYRIPNPVPAAYAALNELVHNPSTHLIILCLLRRECHNRTHEDMLLFLTLHMLHLALVLPQSAAASDGADWHTGAFRSNGVRENARIRFVAGVECTATDLSALASAHATSDVCSILEALLVLQAHDDLSAHKDYIEQILQLLCPEDSTNAHLWATYKQCVQDFADAKQNEQQTFEMKRQAAKRRQSQMLAQFAAQRKSFLDGVEAQEPPRADEDMSAQGVNDANTHSIECVICGTTDPVSAERPVGLVATVQIQRAWASRRVLLGIPKIIDTENGSVRPTDHVFFAPMDVQSCCHCIHYDCFVSYKASAAHALVGELDVRRGEYRCPLCRRICNTFAPLLSNVVIANEVMDDNASLEQMVTALYAAPPPPDLINGSLAQAVRELHRHIRLCFSTEVGVAMTSAPTDAVLIEYAWRCAMSYVDIIGWEGTVSERIKTASSVVHALWAYSRGRTTMELLVEKIARLWQVVSAGGGLVPWPHGVHHDNLVHSTALDMRTVLMRLIWYTRVPVELYAHIARVLGRHVQLQAMVVMRSNGMAWTVEPDENPLWASLFRKAEYKLAPYSAPSPDFDAAQSSLQIHSQLCAPFEMFLQTLSQVLYGTKVEYDALRVWEGVPDPLLWAESVVEVTGVRLPSRCGELPAIRTSIPELSRLPLYYGDLFASVRLKRCPVCEQVPSETMICLVCGTLCCRNCSKCSMPRASRELGILFLEAVHMRRQGQLEECIWHARLCGAGTGVFLNIASTCVYLIKGRRVCSYVSPYLDIYGEEDRDLRRGKPVYLSSSRYDRLTNMWRNNEILQAQAAHWIWTELGQLP